MDKQILEVLEMNILSLGENLADETSKLIEMDGSETETRTITDKNGNPKTVTINLKDEVQARVDNLTTDYNNLMKTYNDIVNPRGDRSRYEVEQTFWDKHGDAIIRTAGTLIVAGVSVAESIMFYKWTTNGYIPGRDVNRVKMPRI